LSQFTRVTDGETDRILIARPRLHSMQRGKNQLYVKEILAALLSQSEEAVTSL